MKPIIETSLRKWDMNSLVRELVVGVNEEVPVLDGSVRRYINFDNAASTPTLTPILEKINEFLKWYSNVHRGTGYKSKLSTFAFDHARECIAKFVNGNQPERVVIFTKNTTESVNHLANRIPFKENDVVLTTLMEHHSNDLPWRKVAHTVHVNILDDGRIDDEDLRNKLREYRGRVRILAITGASNVTGCINPIEKYARWAHEAGAKIFVDAAQLAPHRPIDMKSPKDSSCIDYLAFSGHKMYAPFGIGVLVGESKVFEKGDPYMLGGGIVDLVNLEIAHWTELPDKEEAGTQNIVGAVALSEAIKFFMSTGWDSIINHETELTSFALGLMSKIPEIKIYGQTDTSQVLNRLGVIAFNIDNIHHSLVSAILSHEWAIGTRNGCFCAHPYVKSLLKVDEKSVRLMEKRVLKHDMSNLPGTVRISFGIYNTKEEIEILYEALLAIVRGKYKKVYKMDKKLGEYFCENFQFSFSEFI